MFFLGLIVGVSLLFPVRIPWDSRSRPMRHTQPVTTTHAFLLGRMASCGLLPPYAAATPAAAAAAATSGTAAIHVTATPAIEQR